MNELEQLLGCKVTRKLTAKNLKEIRMLFGKTQEEWATFLGVSTTTVQNWERDVASPPRTTHMLIQYIADAGRRLRRTAALTS